MRTLSIRQTVVLSAFALFALMLTSCSGLKGGRSAKIQKLYESFFFGEEGTQFFIKPFAIASQETKEAILLDMTFRYKDELKDTAVVNLSIMSLDLIKQLDEITFKSSSHTYTSTQTNLLFNELERKGYESRFGVKIPVVDLRALFLNSDWVVTVPHASGDKVFVAEGKSQKRLEELEASLFVLTN